jgi:hypothetical protein
VYIDASKTFVIEYIARSYWLALAKVEGSSVARSSTTIGKFRTCREARKAAENYDATVDKQ